MKTLHPAVHAGLLADLRLESHEQQLADLGIAPFELVVVNLYPFVETVASGADSATVVENVDIGGPAMVRASAKNHPNVAIVVSPFVYAEVVEAVRAGGTTLELRKRLAAQAFAHTASYDAAVASYFATDVVAPDAAAVADHAAAPRSTATSRRRHVRRDPPDRGPATATLRYGENAHQAAALYTTAGGAGIAQATQLHGKEMSYNNYVDADAAVRAAYDFDTPAVAIIKHANPCGIAIAPADAVDPIASAHAARTPATRCRPSAGSSPRTARSRSRWPRPSATSSPRSSSPRRSTRGARGPVAEEEHPAPHAAGGLRARHA